MFVLATRSLFQQLTSLGIVLLLAGVLSSAFAQTTTPVSEDARWSDQFGLEDTGKGAWHFVTHSNLVYRLSVDRLRPTNAFTELRQWDIQSFLVKTGSFAQIGPGKLLSRFSGTAGALAVGPEGTIYIGGTFGFTNEPALDRISKWDGVAWTDIGTMPNGEISKLLVGKSGELYACGRFYEIGSVEARNLARWDGARWSPVGKPLKSESIKEMAFSPEGELLVVESLSSKSRILCWQTNRWVARGGVFKGRVNVLLSTRSGELWAGGSFAQIGSDPVLALVRWNGKKWTPPAEHFLVSDGQYPYLDALADGPDGLNVGGNFSHAGRVASRGIARWDGQAWHSLEGGLAGGGISYSMTTAGCFRSDDTLARELVVLGRYLLVSGRFRKAGDVNEMNQAIWNGTAWESALLPGRLGVNKAVNTMAADGTNIYVAGKFTSAGGVPVNCLASWDGRRWSAKGEEWRYRHFQALAFGGDNFYAVFQTNIWKLSGSEWSQLRSIGTNDPVAAMGKHLYIGGSGLLRRNEGYWESLTPTNVDGTISITALAVTENSGLYVAGEFQAIGGVAALNVARWDGTNWLAFGNGVPSFAPDGIRAIAVSGTNVYVAGTLGSVPSPGESVARWDGSEWKVIGGNIDGRINAMTTNGGDLYIGGAFANVSNQMVGRLAKWDGAKWSGLGSGLGGTDNAAVVHALKVQGDELFVGGSFDTAGGKPSANFAVWKLR